MKIVEKFKKLIDAQWIITGHGVPDLVEDQAKKSQVYADLTEILSHKLSLQTDPFGRELVVLDYLKNHPDKVKQVVTYIYHWMPLALDPILSWFKAEPSTGQSAVQKKIQQEMYRNILGEALAQAANQYDFFHLLREHSGIYLTSVAEKIYNSEKMNFTYAHIYREGEDCAPFEDSHIFSLRSQRLVSKHLSRNNYAKLARYIKTLQMSDYKRQVLSAHIMDNLLKTPGHAENFLTYFNAPEKAELMNNLLSVAIEDKNISRFNTYIPLLISHGIENSVIEEKLFNPEDKIKKEFNTDYMTAFLPYAGHKEKYALKCISVKPEMFEAVRDLLQIKTSLLAADTIITALYMNDRFSDFVSYLQQATQHYSGYQIPDTLLKKIESNNHESDVLFFEKIVEICGTEELKKRLPMYFTDNLYDFCKVLISHGVSYFQRNGLKDFTPHNATIDIMAHEHGKMTPDKLKDAQYLKNLYEKISLKDSLHENLPEKKEVFVKRQKI